MFFQENDQNFHSLHLCYGDLIAFENPKENNSFIFSDGFLKTKLNMKTFEQSSKTDFSSCLFQIYPQFANTNKTLALNLAENLAISKTIGQRKKEKIEAMQEKLTDEYSFNLETFNKHKNMSISYGKVVQMMHVASNKFLSVTFVEADIEKENYLITLEEYSSDSTFFKILPSFKYQKESEGKIFVEDIVFLAFAGAYLNKTPYLHCSNTNPQSRDKKLGPSFFQTNLNDIQFHSKWDPEKHHVNSINSPGEEGHESQKQKGLQSLNKPMTEINASLDLPTHWRLHLFSKIIEEPLTDFLSYGDVIWLNNFDKKISLLGRYAKKGALKRGEELLKDPSLDSNQLEILFTDSLISEDATDNLGNTNGMWVMEASDSTKGGLILASDVFRLKHLSSGKYLAAEGKEGGRYEIVALEEAGDKSFFSLKIVQEPKSKGISQQDMVRYVSKDAFIIINHRRSGYSLGIAEVDVERGEKVYQAVLNRQYTDEDVLKVARATTNELLETNFLKSCRKVLMKYVIFLTKLQRKTITVYEIRLIERKTENVSKCLKDLELFITNQLFNTSPYVKYGSVNQRRQKILREQYYIEMLIQLILISMGKAELEKYFFLKEQAKESKEGDKRRGSNVKKVLLKNIVSKIKDGKSGDQMKIQEEKNFLRLNSIKLRIVKLIFRLFIYICKDFDDNEFYIYDLIPSFNYYFEYVTASIDFLISLVRNNEFIMKKVSRILSSLSLSSIDKLSSILEMELANQEDVSKDANILTIANNLKLKLKKNELIEAFIQQISEENLTGSYTRSISITNNIKPDRVQNEEEFKEMKNNLILLFAAIAKKTYKKERNLRLIKFFRTICSFQTRGITSNQEVLSKIFKNDSYHKALLIKVIVDNNGMKIEHNNAKTLFFEEIFLKELREKKINKNYHTNPDNEQEEENPGDSHSLLNKSRIDATFQSLDRGITSSIFPQKEEEKSEINIAAISLEKEMSALISYLNEQVNFYSDLCLGRNYIWKKTLEGIFPMQFIFAQIYNKKVFKETRSAFTRLALNLYIDQQPFSPAIYPELCRIYAPNPLEILPENQENLVGSFNANQLDQKVFEGLLKESLAYISGKTAKIQQALLLNEKKPEKNEKNEENASAIINDPLDDPFKPKFKNFLNNMLLLDVLQLLSKLLSFKLFDLIKEEDAYLVLFPNLVSLLEFDFSNPLISLSIVNKREKQFKELLEQENKQENLITTGFSGIKSLFTDVVDNVTGLTKEMAGTLLGQTVLQKSSKKKANKFLDRYNEIFLYSQPLMRSCVSQRNKLSLLAGEEKEGRVYKVEKELKILVLDVIKQFLSMRHDFLISNFIAWYQELSSKYTESFSEEKARLEINENLLTVLPGILKLGIPGLDLKYQIKEEQNVLNNVGNNLKNFVGNIGNIIMQEEDSGYLLKRFKCYSKDREFKDLDGLLAGPLELKNSLISKTLYPSLIMMFYTNQDPVLACKFLEVIMLCFHQRMKFSQDLKDLELLFDRGDIDNYLHISRTVKTMGSICEKSEVWISEWLNGGGLPPELPELKKIVSFLTRAFHTKLAESQLEIEEEEEEEEEAVFVNPVRQKMSFFLEIHNILIDFLKDTVHLTEKILKEEHIELMHKQLFLSLYKKVFLWFRFFVKENPNNQEVLHTSLSQFFFHMDLNLGQTELFCEIFRNNQGLCENIRTKTLNEFLNLIQTIGRREIFLTFFEVLQTAHGSYIFETQAKIINVLLGSAQTVHKFETLAHILYAKEQDNALVFDFNTKPLNYYISQHKNNNSYKTQFNESLYGDKPYKYHANLLRVLGLTGQGIQGFNLSNARLRKLFNLSFIFILLSEEDSITTSNKNIRRKSAWQELKDVKNIPDSDNNILNLFDSKIYKSQALETEEIIKTPIKLQEIVLFNKEEEDNEESISPFSKKLNAMKKDRSISKLNTLETKEKASGVNKFKPALLKYLLDVYLPTIKKEKDEFQAINVSVQSYMSYEINRFSNIIDLELRSEAYKDYFFDGFLKFLVSYVINIVTPGIILDNIDSKDNELSFNLAESLVSRLKALENCLTMGQMKNMNDFIRLYYEEEEEISRKLELCVEEDERKYNKMASQSNMSTMTEVFDEGLDNATGWKAFIKLVLKSDVLEKEIEKEKKALCESFIKIHMMFDEEEKKRSNINVGMKDVLQKLVDYIQFALTNHQNKETITFTLEILINIVNIYPKKVEIQNILDQINALTMIFTVIAEMKTLSIPEDIFEHLLRFLIVMIEGGNKNSQKTVYNYFITIPNSEYVFETFSSIINDQIEELKAKKQDSLGRESKRKKKANENENLKKSILEKILRIMQMLTEGHYLEMQLYLREQTNSRNSYDLVSLVIELLYVYHTDLSNYNYYNILRCFETLTELVQGPCTANQNALIEGKFLEIAFTILTISVPKTKKNLQEKSPNKKSKKDKSPLKKDKSKMKTKLVELTKIKKPQKIDPNRLKRWMLERIKYKCMILITSLLEMKQGFNVVKRIIRSLPSEVLKTNLCDTYRRYKKKYGPELKIEKEALKKYEEDPDDKNNKHNESKYELIIETGFLSFFMINEYLEIIQDPELDFQMPAQNDQTDGLLKGNIIGQLWSLVTTLIKSGVDTVSSVGRSVINTNKLKQLLKAAAEEEEDEVEKEKLKKENRMIELKEVIFEAVKFFNYNSGHIEVLRGRNLEKVYFMLPTYCHFLPEDTRNDFNERVDRTSLESKLEQFVKESKEFIRIAKHEERLSHFFNQNKILAIFASYVSLWKELAFLINIVLNIMIIFSFSDFTFTERYQGYYLDSNNETVNMTENDIWEKRMYDPHLMGIDSYSSQYTKDIMQKCGIVMIVCAGFVVLFFLCKKAPLYIQQSWGEEKIGELDEEEEQNLKKKPLSIRIFQFITKVATCFIKFFLNVDVVYYSAYATLAILGVVVHEFFFCFHLTELFFRFPTLKNVIKSVYEPREALYLTLILWVIFEFVFAIWAFIFLRDQYTPYISGQDDDLNTSYCKTLLTCFVYTFDFTFKSNGGIGSQLDSLRNGFLSDNPGQAKYTISRFFFDNLFTLLIAITMVTIVAGIIIDTFGLLRDNENAKMRDMERICFICGLNKEIFERQVDLKKGFSMHITNEHFQWNYVYFIAFLIDKDPGEYTGIESYIREKLETEDLGWFPKFRSLSLKAMEEEGEEFQNELICKCEEDMANFKKGTIILKESLALISRTNNSSSL